MGNTVPKVENALRFGVISDASILEKALIEPALATPQVVIRAIAARSKDDATACAKKNNIPTVHDTYDDVLADPDVDCVYIPLPNSLHAEWTIKAIKARKHVLVEKPLCSNEDEARKIAAALQEAPDVVVMEGYHWLYHPAAKRALAIASGPEMGALSSISIEMVLPRAYFIPGNLETDIRFKYHLAGGTMMDLGCYALSFIVAFAGAAKQEILAVDAATAVPLPAGLDSQVDLAMSASYTLTAGKAHLHVSFEHYIALPVLSIEANFSNGTLYFTNPLGPEIYHAITVEKADGTTRTEKAYGPEVQSTFWHQLQAFASAVTTKTSFPSDVAHGQLIMSWIDATYVKAGLMKRGKGSPHPEQ